MIQILYMYVVPHLWHQIALKFVFQHFSIFWDSHCESQCDVTKADEYRLTHTWVPSRLGSLTQLGVSHTWVPHTIGCLTHLGAPHTWVSHTFGCLTQNTHLGASHIWVIYNRHTLVGWFRISLLGNSYQTKHFLVLLENEMLKNQKIFEIGPRLDIALVRQSFTI